MPKFTYRNKEGVVVPSVTTVLENLGWKARGLAHWAWEQGVAGRDYREERDYAATVGTLAHKMVEIDLRTGCLTRDDITRLADSYGDELVKKALIAFDAWVEWKQLVQFDLVASEHPMVSEELQVGGCLDVGLVQSMMGILDLKVTSDIRPEHRIQVCTYAYIWNENNPDKPVEGLYWLKLGKVEPSFSYSFMPYDSRPVKAAIEVFKHLRAIHELGKEVKKWR